MTSSPPWCRVWKRLVTVAPPPNEQIQIERCCAHRLLPSFVLISYLFFYPAHDGLGHAQGLTIFLMTYRRGKTGIASEHSKAGEARALTDDVRGRLPNVFE